MAGIHIQSSSHLVLYLTTTLDQMQAFFSFLAESFRAASNRTHSAISGLQSFKASPGNPAGHCEGAISAFMRSMAL
jgi:hypothetical protein